ncbi:aldose epimerase family protein [Nitratireductor sp. StC3]|uniref:aldose epimerase family protein n=1 Tax=Nitratireductor sp. StC3 TaxID=2126741 RepID=UPI000D0DCB3B|nr:aldose epimerase family protein [Nitratireductor sp. StC3]PSM17947.1 galactose-1-epimerase [Nitratireductor sp. StC3]
MAGPEMFGTTEAGEAVHRLAISGGGLRANILTWGAVVQDLRLSGHDAPLVLGFENFADYPAHSPYFGAIAGRYANRIRDGHFTIEGQRFETDRNFLGKHTLHGGSAGIGKRVWQLAAHGADFVALSLKDTDGTMGFPGDLELSCTYRLKLPGTLSVELSATAEAPTLCNLAHHSYFNLDDGGSGDILDHRAMIAASAYLPVDAEMIPTGVVAPVEGTAFDFLLPRPIRHADEHNAQLAYDHNFCLAAARGPLRQAAWVQSAHSGVEMEVWTTEPGIQFYAGHKLAPQAAGLGGRRYRAHAGFCLEPQVWPDSPNRPYFPQAVLWPGDRYRQVTEYRFR